MQVYFLINLHGASLFFNKPAILFDPLDVFGRGELSPIFFFLFLLPVVQKRGFRLAGLRSDLNFGVPCLCFASCSKSPRWLPQSNSVSDGCFRRQAETPARHRLGRQQRTTSARDSSCSYLVHADKPTCREAVCVLRRRGYRG